MSNDIPPSSYHIYETRQLKVCLCNSSSSSLWKGHAHKIVCLHFGASFFYRELEIFFVLPLENIHCHSPQTILDVQF